MSGDERWSTIDSPVGPLTLVASAVGLRAVWFDDETRPVLAPGAEWRGASSVVAHAGDPGTICDAAAAQLAEYFGGVRTIFDLPLDLRGTPFQGEVWAALLAIPAGRTRAYGAIAKEISAARSGPATSARAVAAAVGRTPVPIIVPCHRAIGAAGALTGYRGGLHRKRALLELEGAAIVADRSGSAATATAASGQLPLL